MILDKLFYCGSKGVEDTMPRFNFNDAVAQAQMKLTADPSRHSVAVVQIVAIVRRTGIPVDVERVYSVDDVSKQQETEPAYDPRANQASYRS